MGLFFPSTRPLYSSHKNHHVQQTFHSERLPTGAFEMKKLHSTLQQHQQVFPTRSHTVAAQGSLFFFPEDLPGFAKFSSSLGLLGRTLDLLTSDGKTFERFSTGFIRAGVLRHPRAELRTALRLGLVQPKLGS